MKPGFKNRVLAAVLAVALGGAMATAGDLRAGDPPAASADGEKLLCGFEKDEVARWGAKFKSESDTAYVTERFTYYVDVGAGSTETATQGRWALARKLVDQYGCLKPGNKTHPYELHRGGTVLCTHGWFRRAFPADWSGYDFVRVDVRAEGTGVRLRLDLEDEFLPDPIVRQFPVPEGRWVTLEVDLARATKERRLNLAKMANMILTVVESRDGAREFVLRVDNIRLAKAGTAAPPEVLCDDSPMALPAAEGGPVKDLAAIDIAQTAKAAGEVGVIPMKGGGYALMAVMDRCVGGFGDGGIIVVPGPTAYLSRDAGATWTGLGGEAGGTRLTGDFRGAHRATATVIDGDVLLGYCTAKCAGGGGRTLNKATSALRAGDRWRIGPETAFETGQRHCVDRLSIVRAPSGRVWVAWNHVNAQNGSELRAKWTAPEGAAWYQGGENARIFPSGAAGGAGPYLSPHGSDVACFWRMADRGTFWSRVVPLKVKVTAVSPDGKITLAAGAAQGIRQDANVLLEKDGKTAAVLTVVDVGETNGVAIAEPGAVAARVGDELRAFAWSPAQEIEKGRAEPSSAATARDGTLFLALVNPVAKTSKVMRLDGERWVQDSPAGVGRRPLLVATGDRMACVWHEEKALSLAVRGKDGAWCPARKIAEEQDGIETLAAPQTGPETFLPVAWSTKKRDAVRVAAVPVP